MASLRELLLSIKVKVDKSGVQASDEAFQQATRSATALERAIKRVAAAQKALGDRKAKADEAFAQSLGFGTKTRPRPPVKGALKIDNTDLLASLETKPKTALESLKETFNRTFAAAGGKLKSATATVDSLAAKLFSARTAVAGFAAAIVGHEIYEFIAGVVESGKSLAEMSARTRVSVESLQGWRTLVAKAGIDSTVLESSFRKLAKASRAGLKETSTQGKAFKDLGVDVKNSDGSLRGIEDIMVDVGTALAGLTDDTKASAIAVQLLGPAGYGLVPAFEAGGAAVKQYLAAARENVSISTEEAKRLKEVGEEVERGGKKWTGLKNRLVIAMLPALEFVARKFEAVSKWLFTTAKQSQIFQTILGALAAGGLARLVILLGAWITKAGGARAALSLLGGGLHTAAGFALRFIAPLLIIEDFLTFLAGGKSLFGRAFNEIFGEGGAKKVREGLLGVFKQLADAIHSAGEALRAFAGNDVFTGLAKGALDAILVTLNLLGLALTHDAEQAERLKQALLGATKPNPNSPFSKPPKAAEEIGNKVFGDIEDKTSWFQRFRKGAQNLLTPNRTLVHERVANALNADGTNMSVAPAALNYSPVPLGAIAPGANSSSKSVTLTDNRKIEVNVSGGTPSPGATGRATASAVSGALETDSRQVLQSVSE